MSHRDTIIENISIGGKISIEGATKVFDYYRTNQIIKFGAHDGFYFTHGAFLDADVIKRAFAQATA